MNIEQIPYSDRISRHDYYQPNYRVDFWRQQEPPPGSDAEKMGYALDAYRIREAKNVHEVRAWAEQNAEGRMFVIWIESGPEDDRTIVRVEGVDPTKPGQRPLAE